MFLYASLWALDTSILLHTPLYPFMPHPELYVSFYKPVYPSIFLHKILYPLILPCTHLYPFHFLEYPFDPWNTHLYHPCHIFSLSLIPRLLPSYRFILVCWHLYSLVPVYIPSYPSVPLGLPSYKIYTRGCPAVPLHNALYCCIGICSISNITCTLHTPVNPFLHFKALCTGLCPFVPVLVLVFPLGIFFVPFHIHRYYSIGLNHLLHPSVPLYIPSYSYVTLWTHHKIPFPPFSYPSFPTQISMSLCIPLHPLTHFLTHLNIPWPLFFYHFSPYSYPLYPTQPSIPLCTPLCPSVIPLYPPQTSVPLVSLLVTLHTNRNLPCPLYPYVAFVYPLCPSWSSMPLCIPLFLLLNPHTHHNLPCFFVSLCILY